MKVSELMVSSELKRVVVTGLRAITPLENTVTEYWQGLIKGRSGIGSITLFDASIHACRIAGEVKGFDPSDYLESKDAKRMDRFAQFAVCVSLQAIADARFAQTVYALKHGLLFQYLIEQLKHPAIALSLA